MKPIIFSMPMVQTILEGRKTQTRRVVKPQPSSGLRKSVFVASGLEDGHGREIKVPYQPGDTLYVRETWYYEYHMYDENEGDALYRYVYKASSPDYPVDVGVGKQGWRPSIHMPKEAARIFLKVKDARAERLQEISEEDAIAEGLACLTKDGGITYKYGIPDSDGLPGNDDTGWHWHEWNTDPRKAFQALWNKIYEERGYGWDMNPWVWVISFERIDKPKEGVA
jgi:hypothetical protein